MHTAFTYETRAVPLLKETPYTVPVVSRRQYSRTILQVMTGSMLGHTRVLEYKYIQYYEQVSTNRHMLIIVLCTRLPVEYILGTPGLHRMNSTWYGRVCHMIASSQETMSEWQVARY